MISRSLRRTYSSVVHIDEAIAKKAKTLPISQVFASALPEGLENDFGLELRGDLIAKLTKRPENLDDPKFTTNKKVVLVTAMTPTKAGEGKTATSIGLSDALCRIGKKSVVALREPSLGPVFGMKGGAAGGGYAQVVPMDDINLHFTGDMHAITSTNNLLSSLVDNHLHFRKQPRLDPKRVDWRRVMDLNDRGLRQIVSGLGPKNGTLREDGFDITAASEVMAIFCLSLSLEDLKRRLGQIVVGYDLKSRAPVQASALNAQGAMTALLRKAFDVNVVQTLENNVAIVHGGPFANIAHGCSSAVATRVARAIGEYTVTEAGFDSALGGEKFFDIKCRQTGIVPTCAVVVATVKALRTHGKGDPESKNKNLSDAEEIDVGMANLLRHVENVSKFGVASVVALNRFPTDTDEEVSRVIENCAAHGVLAVEATHWADGGAGAVDLAKAVVDVCEDPAAQSAFRYLYPDDAPLRAKIETIATEIYRAKDVEYSSTATLKLKRYQKLYPNFPVCVAKTQYSFSDDKKKLNAPSGHTLSVTDVRLSAGAEFIVVLTGEIMTMPGLPRIPSAENIDVDGEGEIVGLF